MTRGAPAPDETGQDEAGCPACPHPARAHDTLARRFCSATLAGAPRRGCVCSGGTGGATYGRSPGGSISDRA
ncbi:RGCVC family protein [Actinosynnema pretiosum]|uniref:Uncharacterized protein n=1 Tax=Actinosynnema pretiosum TaxID=42197 RepID=A0A290Z9Z2_9PSEU|nr:RGCVC family protein [Actinosynnema pretiosum]ATE55789.1 hypothetical protein CNX65_22985 [Actinosynnema pretiosum]